jgi:hypothetical protein
VILGNARLLHRKIKLTLALLPHDSRYFQAHRKKGVSRPMDSKCSVFIAASVDGFIARPDGDIEWLHRPEYEGAELNGVTYEHFITTVDALVMGRKTLEKCCPFRSGPMRVFRCLRSLISRLSYLSI